jgi:hypothetical protein
MKKPMHEKVSVVLWRIGDGMLEKNLYHPKLFSGNGVRLILDRRTLRWWSVTIRLYFDGSLNSVSLRPDRKITITEVFDLIKESISRDYSDDEIQAATNIDALLVAR